MKPALIILAVLAAVGLVLWLADRRREPGSRPAAPPATGCDDNCCGVNEVCPSEKVLAAQCGPVVYYDDEELDLYRGRTAEQYAEEEVEQWRDVLVTLRARDVVPWGQSLKRRGLVLPAALRDEFMLLAADTQ